MDAYEVPLVLDLVLELALASVASAPSVSSVLSAAELVLVALVLSAGERVLVASVLLVVSVASVLVLVLGEGPGGLRGTHLEPLAQAGDA